MNKTGLIISREYMTRVKKKSFIVMTILGPILFAALFIAPAWIASMKDTDIKTIAVLDSSSVFLNKIPDTDYIKFKYLENTSLEDVRKSFSKSEYYAILQILPSITYEPTAVHLFSTKQPSFAVKNYISSTMEKELKNQKLRAAGINEEVLKSIKSDVSIRTIQWTEDGKEKEGSTEIAMAVGYVSGFLIYFFIFMFGSQVMRGVIEEKSSRIVEIIISSARPFELMMGKIVGVALVGLTQFFLWIILTFAIVAGVKTFAFPELGTKNAQEVVAQDMFAASGQNTAEVQQVMQQKQNMQEFEGIFNSLKSVDYGVMIGSFIFFFLGGYLLYGSLFAAIGSAVDNEADTQQFMLPITIPLILGMFVMMNAIQTPESSVAFWFSIIPFTSPIVMMVRIPFGVPYWELALSMGILIITFIFTTWLAGKIYRTGILMYGKKINYKELWKWIRYKY
jgi:ABC-2 type transport system permease protein